jgi:hypothetical protein
MLQDKLPTSDIYAHIEDGSVLEMWQNLEQQILVDPRAGEFLNGNANKLPLYDLRESSTHNNTL